MMSRAASGTAESAGTEVPAAAKSRRTPQNPPTAPPATAASRAPRMPSPLLPAPPNLCSTRATRSCRATVPWISPCPTTSRPCSRVRSSPERNGPATRTERSQVPAPNQAANRKVLWHPHPCGQPRAFPYLSPHWRVHIFNRKRCMKIQKTFRKPTDLRFMLEA